MIQVHKKLKTSSLGKADQVYLGDAPTGAS